MAALRHRWVILLMLGYGATACSDGVPTVSPTAPTTTLTAAPPAPTSPPPGVEFIRGWVRDTAFRPLSRAQVELLTGPQAGVVATTDSTGEFSFTATVDDGSRLRASKEGHMTADVTLGPVCSGCPGRPGRSVSFFLQVPNAPAAIAGDYTLTFTADSACTTLPEQLRSRTYEVTIAPSRFMFGSTPEATTSFQVAPRGGTFSGRIRFFWVNVAGNFIALSFGDVSFDPSVIEAVAPYGHVAFGGSAAVTVVDSLSSVVTPFTGSIEYCVNPEISEDGYRCTAPATSRARCDSESHQLVLTRR
jgi:hypothetical protein